jgi:hypothetical protein
LGVESKPAINDLAVACVRSSGSFNATNAANSLWAAQNLGITDERLISPLIETCVRLSNSFNLYQSAKTLLVLKNLKVKDKDILSHFVHPSSKHTASIPHRTGRENAESSSALHRASERHRTSIIYQDQDSVYANRFEERTHRRSDLDDHDERVIARKGSERKLSPQELGLALGRVIGLNSLEDLLQTQSFNAKHLTSVCNVLASKTILNTENMKQRGRKLFLETLERYCDDETFPPNIAVGKTPGNMALIFYAGARLADQYDIDFLDDKGFRRFIKRLMNVAHDLNNDSAYICLKAAALLKIKYTPAILAFTKACVCQSDQFTSNQLHNIRSFLKVLGVRDDAAFSCFSEGSADLPGTTLLDRNMGIQSRIGEVQVLQGRNMGIQSRIGEVEVLQSEQEMTSSELTDLIRGKSSLKRLEQVFTKYKHKLDATQLSAICHSLSTAIVLETPTQKQMASELFLSSLTLWSNDEIFPPIRVPGKEGMDFAKIFFAAATLIKKEVPIPTTDIRFVKFIESVGLYFTSLNAEETAQCMWAAGTLGINDKQLTETLSEACHIFSNKFTRQDVDKCMWAVDVLKIVDSNLLSCLVKACVRLSSSS